MNHERIEQSRRYSHIGIHSSNNYVYAHQYQTAFEVLYESNCPVDTIALPLLYNLRHYIELMLKYNIEYFSKYSGSRNMVGKSGHHLLPLFTAFKEHWVLVKHNFKIKIDDSKLMLSLTKLISELIQLDGNSVSFRYSHELNKDKNFNWLDKVDIYKLKKLFDDAKLILNHSIDVFDEKTGLMDGYVTEDELIQQVKNQ